MGIKIGHTIQKLIMSLVDRTRPYTERWHARKHICRHISSGARLEHCDCTREQRHYSFLLFCLFAGMVYTTDLQKPHWRGPFLFVSLLIADTECRDTCRSMCDSAVAWRDRRQKIGDSRQTRADLLCVYTRGWFCQETAGQLEFERDFLSVVHGAN